MACSEFIPAASMAAWIGASALASGTVLFAYSRQFTIEKVGAFGLEFKLSDPIKHPGEPKARWPAIITLFLGMCFTVAGGIKAATPAEWPKKLSEVCSADVQLSKVDDLMEVLVNDKLVLRARYGETPKRVDIATHLIEGPNKVEVIVHNGLYGGCGGQLVLRLNGMENTEFKWSKQKLENHLPNVICFMETFTLDLS